MSNKNMPKNFEDLTGKTFGYLKVLSRELNAPNGRTMWLCLCECGTKKIVAAHELRNGAIRSCGCAKRKELKSTGCFIEGRRFGMLVAKECVGETSRKSPIWRCECDCGNMINASYGELKHGKVKSCGRVGLDDVKKDNLKDMTGLKFERLLVMGRAQNSKDGKAMWECLCDCGNIVVVGGKELRRGHTKSCGCFHANELSKRNKTHGLCYENKRLYGIWCRMKERCFNKNSADYYLYGGRGICVCEEWRSYENFYNWSIRNNYSDELSIERIDVNGNYEPDNCKWIRMEEQAFNKRCTIRVMYDGEMQSLAKICKENNFNYRTISYRYYAGWKDEDLFKPIKKKKQKAV